jgi:hypothetical protein
MGLNNAVSLPWALQHPSSAQRDCVLENNDAKMFQPYHICIRTSNKSKENILRQTNSQKK